MRISIETTKLDDGSEVHSVIVATDDFVVDLPAVTFSDAMVLQDCLGKLIRKHTNFEPVLV